MNNVKKYRDKKHWTQKELAVKAGMYVSEISRFEQEKQMPTLNRAQSLARALGVTVDDLFPMEVEQ